jgi:hypothetical protein
MDKPNDRISARMREVFDAVPELERWPGHTWSAEACADVQAEITNFALELIADDPRYAEALRGRTFARSLQ